MSWTRRFLPTNFLCYPCFYTYINAKTEHIIRVVSFEWSDITEFSNKSSETSVMSSNIKKFCYMQRHIKFVVFYCFFFRLSPEEVQIHFVGRFIRRYSGDIQKRAIKHAPVIPRWLSDVKSTKNGKISKFYSSVRLLKATLSYG